MRNVRNLRLTSQKMKEIILKAPGFLFWETAILFPCQKMNFRRPVFNRHSEWLFGSWSVTLATRFRLQVIPHHKLLGPTSERLSWKCLAFINSKSFLWSRRLCCFYLRRQLFVEVVAGLMLEVCHADPFQAIGLTWLKADVSSVLTRLRSSMTPLRLRNKTTTKLARVTSSCSSGTQCYCYVSSQNDVSLPSLPCCCLFGPT